MSTSKKLFGYFLILFLFLFIFLLGFPQVYLGENAGRIEKKEHVQANFLKDEKAQVVLLYFGYLGCKTVCVPSMNELRKLYIEHDAAKELQVYFISLLEEDQDSTQAYAEYFNKDFKGITLPKKELQKLMNVLGAHASTSLFEKTELNHAAHLYVLSKNKKDYFTREYIYTTRPYNMELVKKDINNLFISESKE